MTDRTHVPDKVEAFLLQVRHALFELIKAPDEKCVISVEAYDDVSLENDGRVIAEQIKSSLSSNNPASNRSVSFWKTLANWCTYLEEGQMKADALKLIVVSPDTVTIGSIPEQFNNASKKCEAEKAIDDAFILLEETSTNGNIASEECKRYIDYCYQSEHRSTFVEVVKLFSVDLHNGTYDETLKRKFCEQPIPLEYADQLFITMLGWVNEKAHGFTKKNKPAFISKKEYNAALRKEIRGRNQTVILSSVSTQPDRAEADYEIDRHDTYIKQLELIELGTDDIYSAAVDYLRTCAEKTYWAQKGLVNDLSFDDYYDSLRRMWESKNSSIRLLYSRTHSDQERGQLLYHECKSSSLPMRLQGCSVPSFFGSGSLHCLANEPANSPQIGWHPNYCVLIKGEDGNEQDE